MLISKMIILFTDTIFTIKTNLYYGNILKFEVFINLKDLNFISKFFEANIY